VGLGVNSLLLRERKDDGSNVRIATTRTRAKRLKIQLIHQLVVVVVDSKAIDIIHKKAALAFLSPKSLWFCIHLARKSIGSFCGRQTNEILVQHLN
jgi:hypothetical protein